ncbi:MAG: amino acid permease [Bacillota bacterium]
MSEKNIQQEELVKDLGLTEALTIGIGVMIGAGIFILPRFAIGNAGPAAIFSYILAGLIAMISAASTAEVATGMPKSGGLYYFISRALGTFWGTIAGVALWLSLSFAVAFYLQGFGEYLAMLLPFQADHIAIALIVGVMFIVINYRGVKESGTTQNIITAILLAILIGFVGWGAFNVDPTKLTPFFPYGGGEILPVTALVFVSFIGFGEIAAVAEEVQNPGRNLPLALFGSVIIPTVLYVAVILVAAGILPLEGIIDLEAPIVEAARAFAGTFGAIAVTFGALMATASSANASVLASSRISFAMGRDKILPDFFNDIHEKYFTPSKAILLTGGITIFLVLVANVENLSGAAGVLTLVNYALVNVAVIVLRMRPPEDYRPNYTTPGYPYLQVIGAVSSVGIIFMADRSSQISAVVLIGLSLVWYFIYSRKKSTIQGVSAEINWEEEYSFINTPDNLTPVLPSFNTDNVERKPEIAPYHLMTAVANPDSGRPLLNISNKLLERADIESEISVLNIIEIPEQLSLEVVRDDENLFEKRKKNQKDLFELSQELSAETGNIINPRIKYSRNKYKTMHQMIVSENVDFLMLGWQGTMNISKISKSLVGQMVRKAPCKVGVLKDRNLEEIQRVIVPFRGSEHATFGLDLAGDFCNKEDAIVTVLRVIKPGGDKDIEYNHAKSEVEKVLTKSRDINYEIKVVENEVVADGIIEETNNDNYDLLIIGASKEWRVKNILFGSIPDVVADSVDCSVLMVRTFGAKISKEVKRFTDKEDKKIVESDEPEKI